jgi:amino acid transporter
MPLSGGESVYLSRAFHPVVGFQYTWITGTLAKPSGAAAISVVFADYLCRLHWQNTDLQDTAPEWTRKGIAIGVRLVYVEFTALLTPCLLKQTSKADTIRRVLPTVQLLSSAELYHLPFIVTRIPQAIWFLALVQLLSTKAATSVQDFFTVEKLVLIFALCAMGVWETADPQSLNNNSANLAPANAFKGTSTDMGDWAQALSNCLFSYNGWNNLNLAVGEVVDASTTVHCAVLIGV